MTFKRWSLALALGALAAVGCKASSGGGSPSGTDPRLRGLLVSGDAPSAMVPYYDQDRHLYNVILSSSITTASVTATPADAGVRSVTVAQLGVGTATVPGGTAVPFAVPDVGGTATLRVVSTTPDGKASAGYTLQVSRRTAVGTDGTMASLTDSLGRLTFAPATTTYAYNVLEAEADGYTLTPTTSDPLASLTVNGDPAVSGRPFAPTLVAGDNVFEFVVASEDGVSQSSTYTVTVTMVPKIPVTGVSLACPPYIGNGDVLAATMIPANATDTAVTWSSSDASIATFDDSGHVVVNKPTKQFDPPITLTATTHEGGFTATCDVHVLWFYDNFEDLPAGAVGPPGAQVRKWNLLPVAGPAGAFSITSDGSNVLLYTAGGTGGVLATLQDAAWPAAITGDYYVEARIKPLTNSTTANKQLYLVARYQDANNWYAAGLNMQTSSPSRVEMAKDTAGTVAAPSSWRFTNKQPVMGTWYTVRLEVVGASSSSDPAGPTLTMYLDGEKLGTVTDATAPLFASGKIGLFTNNKSFEIDEVKVGDPADKPVLLAISPNTSYAADVGETARVITVTAQKPNYTSGTYDADTFTAVSSDSTVVSVSISGSNVSLSPVGAGTATITFTSGSDPTLTRQITATVTQFVMPTATYSLAGRVSPVAAATGINADTRLSITFDSAPTMGTGSVRIYKVSDDSLVDVIKPTGETDSYGCPGQSAVRMLNVSLLKVSGNTLTIIPHHNKLAYGTAYYVAIPNGLVTGTSLALNGTAWVGIGKTGNWSFTTKAAPATSLASLTVDAGGAGDFSTVQGALDYFMQNATADAAVTVNVNDGTYDEPLFLRNKNNLTILGQSRTGAVIQFRNAEALNSGSGGSQPPGGLTPTGGRSVFLVEACDLLTLQNLTLKNTTPRSSSGAQAEVIYFNNDTGRLVAKQANFMSEQDTLQLKGYNWFYQSLIAGNVDYIWGFSHAALFENSEIRTIGDTANSTSGWYIVQARVASATDKGFVFLNSQITHGAGPVTGDVTTNVYLARAQNGAWSDQVVYVNCAMDTHIMPVGWYTGTASTPVYPNPNPATQTAGWREFGSTKLADGTPLDVSQRSTVSAQLTSATGYSTRAEVFSAISWNPTP